MSDTFHLPRFIPSPFPGKHAERARGRQLRPVRDAGGVVVKFEYADAVVPVPTRQRVVLGSRPAMLPPGAPVTGAAVAYEAVTA